MMRYNWEMTVRWFVGSGFLRGWEAKVRPPTFAGRSLLGIQPGDYLPGFAVFFPNNQYQKWFKNCYCFYRLRLEDITVKNKIALPPMKNITK
jgi:hypothetical protein